MCAAQPITNDGANTVHRNDNTYPNTKEYTMMMNTTLEQLRELKLAGMATGLQEQLTQAGMTAMSFEERFSLLVDREVWAAAGFKDTLLRWNMKLEVANGHEKEIQSRVQA
jgi:hypothetical protein